MFTLIVWCIADLFLKLTTKELTQDIRTIMMFICVVSDLYIILREFFSLK